MLVEIHMLKNYAPSNLNRDNTGSPKNALFAGVQRGRISSQCLKRSWRTSDLFRQAVGENQFGIRTRCLPDLVADKLIAMGVPQERVELIKPQLATFGKKEDREEGKEGKKAKKDDNSRTKQIIFFAPEDIQAVAQVVKKKMDACKSDAEIKAITAKDLQAKMKKGNRRAITLDIALFGRMVTSDAFADVEAAMQVAHAISTNRVMMESDFFTAVDDCLQGRGGTGSAMMDDVDYNSSCYYIYASLDTDELRANLANSPDVDALMEKVVPLMVEVMAVSNPSGKQNTFAAHALPSAILVECKGKKIPVSYANAFERPIRPDENGGLVKNSAAALIREEEKIRTAYALPVEKRLWFTTEAVAMPEEAGITCKTFPDLLAELPCS